MGEFGVALSGTNGCVFVVKKCCDTKDESSDVVEDDLLLKVIKSKLKTPNNHRECEITSPSDGITTAFIAYGNSEERKLIFETIKNERRSYLLTFYNPMPLHILSSRIGDFIKMMNNNQNSYPEIIMASWTNQNNCELYSVNTCGESYKCFGCVIGHGKEVAKRALLKLDVKNLNVRQLLTHAAKIVNDHCVEGDELQMSWICDETNGKHQYCDQTLIDEVMRSI